MSAAFYYCFIIVLLLIICKSSVPFYGVPVQCFAIVSIAYYGSFNIN